MTLRSPERLSGGVVVAGRVAGARESALQSRTGRIVTSAWPDLAAAAGLALPEGTVLDGEAVIWNEGALDFAAVQARAASAAARARLPSLQLPATYAIFDLLAHPELGDIRPRSYDERRALLLDVLADVGPHCRRYLPPTIRGSWVTALASAT